MSKLSYWERRKAQLMVDQMGKAEAFADELALAYDQASRYLQGQTDKIFDKFRRDYGLTEQQARQILKQADQLDNLNDLKQVLAAQPDDPNITRLLADLDSPAYAHRLEQLERTQRQASEIVQALAGIESKRSEEFYAGLAEDSFHRSTFELQQQSGLAYHFNSPSEAEISSLLRSRWEGGSFSSRIWNNTQSLSQGLKTELLISLLSGRSDRETAEAIAKRFEAGKYNSRRLVRTESAFFHGQMELKSYEEADVEWYRFVAVLDLRTSSKCQHQDGKTYKVSEAVTGVTYPPLHPWCRSTTIASDDKEWLSKLERRARDPETGKNIFVPGDMTYKEWYAKYVEKKREYTDEDLRGMAEWSKRHENQVTKPYRSVKDEWLANVEPKKAKVSDLDFWEYNGVIYPVDGYNVVLDYSAKEKETAQWLSQLLGRHVELAPRVNIPEGIHTPDFLVDGIRYDLKEITGSGKNVIDGNLRKAKKQAENIVFDITDTELSGGEVVAQLERVYELNRRGLNIAIIKDDDKLIDILKANKNRSDPPPPQ